MVVFSVRPSLLSALPKTLEITCVLPAVDQVTIEAGLPRSAVDCPVCGRLSIGPQTGPPIGVQKGPLWRRFVLVVHRRDPCAAERPTGGWRSGAWEVPVDPPVQGVEDAIRAGS